MKLIKSLVILFCLLGFAGSASAQTKYNSHLSAARKTGMPAIKNYQHLKSLIAKKKLIHLRRGHGYFISKLGYSRPYLTPRSAKVLKEIGSRFYASTKKTITITSVTRTLYDQKRLVKVNRNAVSTKLSSHNFGCSFDISYIRFSRRKAPNPRLERVLQNLLKQYQNKGRLYFIKERREKCFHITVR